MRRRMSSCPGACHDAIPHVCGVRRGAGSRELTVAKLGTGSLLSKAALETGCVRRHGVRAPLAVRQPLQCLLHNMHYRALQERRRYHHDNLPQAAVLRPCPRPPPKPTASTIQCSRATVRSQWRQERSTTTAPAQSRATIKQDSWLHAATVRKAVTPANTGITAPQHPKPTRDFGLRLPSQAA